MLQWNHVFSNVEIIRHPPEVLIFQFRFNGTTFFQTWKCRNCPTNRHAGRTASMEPRFFKRGNDSSVFLVTGLTRASMEPRFFKRGNSGATLKFGYMDTELQWNHVFSNVEMGYAKNIYGGIFSFNGTTFFQTWK